MVRLSSAREAVAAIGNAHDIEAFAYTIRPGPVLRALEEAARRGARVAVRLESEPYGRGGSKLGAANRATVDRLREAGAQAALDHHVHAKAIVADGALFLDGRNWGSGDFIVRDDDRAGLTTDKRDCLAAEAALIESASSNDRLLVESESFGTGNPVYAALEAAARKGVKPRLMVSARVLSRNHRERAALQPLQRAGVDVRVCQNSEKFAVTSRHTWMGSANATFDAACDDMTDWAVSTTVPDVIAAVRDRLEDRWHNSRTLA